MMEQPAADHPAPQPTTPLADQAGPLLTDLLYPSESDEPVEWVTCPLRTNDPLTVSQLKDWLLLPPAVFVEERDLAEFWEPVLGGADWYGPDERARMLQFERIKQAMQPLTGQQLFRVGDTEIDLYLLGQLPDGSRAGLKTMVVQT